MKLKKDGEEERRRGGRRTRKKKGARKTMGFLGTGDGMGWCDIFIITKKPKTKNETT